MIWSRLYFASLLILLSTTAFKVMQPNADDPVLKSILNKIEAFDKNNKQEKVFIQTDKTYYAAGDTIWFKGYVRAADTHAPTDLSTILNLELLANNQAGIQKRRLEILDGVASGYMVLPENAEPGDYRLVAYTRWMRNYDARFSYIKELPVFNFNKPESKYKLIGKVKPSVSFFPEGGYLVNGLESKLAFKAIDSTGKSMPITGTVVDNSGTTILSFKSAENGAGSFLFRPESGKNYVATINRINAKPLSVALPTPLERGFVMSADNKSDRECVVTVLQSATNNTAPNKVFVVAKSGNKVVFAETKSFNINDGRLVFTIPKAEIPEGVVQITQFSQDGKPQGERLIYVHHRRWLNISLKPTKEAYAPHENVTVAVEVKDQNRIGVPANLSVSVTDEHALLAPKVTLLSYLFLGSNLAEELENATAYITNDLPESKLALDNLLLTQSWRGFKWPEILGQNTPPKKYTAEKDLIFRGRAVSADGAPVPATLLNILMSGTGNAYAAFTDRDGNFSVILPEYETSGEVLFRFFKDDNALSEIKVTSALETLTDWLPTVPEGAEGLGGPYWQKAYDWFRIQKAYYGSIPEKTKPDKANQPALFKKGFTGTTSYNVEAYEQFKDIAELFDEAIEPVTLKKTKTGAECRVFNRQTKKYFTNSPLYIVDGKPTFDNQVVLSLPTEQVSRIEVFNTAEHLQKFSLMGRDGVIAIYTKSNNFNLPHLSDSTIPFEGIFSGREFPQSALKISTAAMPAFQPRLYWQSNIKTDANGKAQITFQNADDVTKYRLVVEAIAPEGLLGVGEIVYQVVKPD